VLNRDNGQFARLAASAKSADVSRIVSFGEHAEADARLIKVALQPDSSTVEARILGADVAYKLGTPGRHLVMNSLAVLAAVALAGADLALGALALGSLQPASGRGTRLTLELASGTALLIDESYNGNPASMRAALAVLRLQPARRRIAVLGDMLELGDAGPDEHRALAAEVATVADCLFACGPLMHELYTAVPAAIRVAHTRDSAALAPILARAVTAGDAILIKGSLGSRMKLVVDALELTAKAA
jgi:UDP-N-acetylmuramoyl-tripeptide--D-alanyl-D-alanine ligase